MLKIDERISVIDKAICENIDLIDLNSVSSLLICQNILSQSRNLVEHIAVKIHAKGDDVEIDWQNIQDSMEYIKHDNKYEFLRKFHLFLQESTSHYTPDGGGAERLFIKYYPFFLLIRNFVKQEYQMDILNNLEKIRMVQDSAIEEYHKKIAERLEIERAPRTLSHSPRMYVNKVIPFFIGQNVYYEVVLTPAYDTTSKFDRFVCFSKVMVPKHYATRFTISYDYISVEGRRMPISIISEYMISIRPCELNNYAKLFGSNIRLNAKHSEYIGMMQYLTISGSSLLDVVTAPSTIYSEIKQIMFANSRVHYFEEVLDKSRALLLDNNAGSNVIRYLIHTLNNKVLKEQFSSTTCCKLTDLNLKWGCIPFDQMPFASSLVGHNPERTVLFECIDFCNREHEFLSRYIFYNMNKNHKLYTSVKEIEEYGYDSEEEISCFNEHLYKGHNGRKIEKFGQNLYIREAFENTKIIIERLQEYASKGLAGYREISCEWTKTFSDIDSEEKIVAINELFVDSKVSLIYGAAGTGKTYLIKHIADFMNDKTILFLANTNPAVDNLRRKLSGIDTSKCAFMTIRKFLLSNYIQTEYDLLILDECSMVSNSDMKEILDKVKCDLMILVGDTYQIESITFGNWFSIARYFLPKYSWKELVIPYRTDDRNLLDFWEKVRNCEDDLTEYMVSHGYATNFDSSVFQKKAADEIILCLNYDGLYGINNINRFLQESNNSEPYRWGIWNFKAGDPILFNESERFTPVLYNNLKGHIMDIELENDDTIWFTTEVERSISQGDILPMGLELLESNGIDKSVVRFKVVRKNESDEENEHANETDVPFQIAYAVSIHKAQGLEYDSVKVVITEDVEDMITHNVFYTAITRSKRWLKIYWTPQSQEKIIDNFELDNFKGDAKVFSAHSGMKMFKV